MASDHDLLLFACPTVGVLTAVVVSARACEGWSGADDHLIEARSELDSCANLLRVQRYEYRVLRLRESMIGGKMSPDKLEHLLNDEARQGWQLKAITSTDVKGRIGPGGVEGLLVTFERPVG